MFLVFGAYVLGNAPDSALTNDVNVKAMINKDFSNRFTVLILGHEDFLEFLG